MQQDRVLKQFLLYTEHIHCKCMHIYSLKFVLRKMRALTKCNMNLVYVIRDAHPRTHTDTHVHARKIKDSLRHIPISTALVLVVGVQPQQYDWCRRS